ERKPLHFDIAEANRVQHSTRFSGPIYLGQFIESDHRAFRHARIEMLNGYFRWLVKVEVEIKHCHDEMLVIGNISRNRFCSVGNNELHAGDVTDRAIEIVKRDRMLNVGFSMRRETARPGVIELWLAVLFGKSRKTLKRIEPNDPTDMRVGFVNGAELRPGHHS